MGDPPSLCNITVVQAELGSDQCESTEKLIQMKNSTGAFQGLLSKFIQILNKQKLQHASDTFLYCTTKLWTCLYLQHFQQDQADLSMLSSFAQSLECRIMNY